MVHGSRLTDENCRGLSFAFFPGRRNKKVREKYHLQDQ
jgi:hypothetical protein